ncbi:CPXCG motif-containing cysteine-rich protein [Haloferula sargassicola]|uniref:CPXCG motif-containing cysteine-rich protein n=1 Tax=Haloferula sargassicola TaxID=490096 RepID=A0ABP9UPP0_9BACT
METVEIQCPTCFEWFEVAVPETGGRTVEMDYDCEVCCRPLVIVAGPGGVWAKSLSDG